MADQVISVSFGRETFSRESVSLSAFIVTAPFRRELPSKAYKRQGALQVFPASAHPEVNGNLYMDTVRVPEGAILLLQCSHKQFSSPILDAGLFLRLRNTGPMLLARASLPAPQEALHTGRFMAFQGRADIVAPDDLEGFGIEPPPYWRSAFTNEEEVAECYDVTTLSPETAPAPRTEIVMVGDEVVSVPVRAARRVRSRRT